MSNPDDDKRRDETLKRMLQTPPKKQAELKADLKKARAHLREKKMGPVPEGERRED